MSNRYDLLVTELAPGVSFACAYSRLAMGWDRARAVSEPPRKMAPRKTYAERISMYHAKREAVAARAVARHALKLYMWERDNWNKAARLDRIIEPKRRKQYIPKLRPNKTHPLLAAYCDEFIKTGNLNPEIATKLREYADAKQRLVRDTARVSTEHAIENPRRRRRNRTGDGGRSASLDAIAGAARE